MEQKVHIRNPSVGMLIGKCLNCKEEVRLRQPWLSKKPLVYDGWYLVHCTNEDCHNYTGMELRMSEMQLADFIQYDEKFLQHSIGKIIDFCSVKGGRRI